MRRGLLLAFWLGVLGLLVMMLGPWQQEVLALLSGDRVVCRVDGALILQNQVAERLQQDLWRRGEAWHSLAPGQQQERREAGLQQLIDERLMHAARVSVPTAKGGADQELHWFQRQLGFADDRYAEALQGQHLSEPALRGKMESLLQDQAWLEAAIASRLGSVSDSAAKAWFDAHRDQAQAPVAIRAAHLFLSSHDPAQPDRKPRIEKLSAELTADPDRFDELVSEFSEDDRTKVRGGDLGWFTRARMPEDFMQAVEKLRPGQTSGPVQTRLGWHLIKLLDRKPARELTFDEAREEVLALLRNERRVNAVDEVMRDLRGKAKIVRDDDALGQIALAE